MGSRRFPHPAIFLFIAAAHAQIIEFESSGLKYKALTHNGVTVMFAPMTTRIHDYAILQVAVSNGSPVSWAIRPEDFRFERADGSMVQASAARSVVETLMDKGNRGDVIKLSSAYEAGLYGNSRIHSTNGYESRRQNAQAAMGSAKLNAAAAASALVLATIKLMPGQTTDGAVFFPNQGRPLGVGKLVVSTAGEVFTFPVDAELLKGR
jgi:hypothetical protein